MICTPGFIWGQQGAEAYKQQATGEDQPFWKGREPGYVARSGVRQCLPIPYGIIHREHMVEYFRR